jgi:hypothetical protein
MKNDNICDRPPTNAEVLYKIFHEWLNFWWKFILLIFKSKLHSTFFVVAVSIAIIFVSAHLNLSDCIEGAKWLISLV